MSHAEETSCPSILAEIAYTSPSDVSRIRIFPPSSGRKMEAPESEKRKVHIFDCRPAAGQLKMDVEGFELQAPVDIVALARQRGALALLGPQQLYLWWNLRCIFCA